jgi:hypothetical protein
MAGLLPIAAASILGLIAIGWPRWTDEAGTTRRRLLMAAAGLAGLVITASELLGLFHRLDFQALTIFWSALLGILLAIGLRNGTLVGGLQRLPTAGRAVANMSFGERLLLAAAACVALVLLLIALQSPPNTVDSLQYHMARVAHWAQNHSLRHYAATYHPQLWNAIGAEIEVLHLYILGQGDQLVNLIQWASMIGAAVAVSVLAAELGGDRRAQLAAAVFGATAPAGLLQATSTQTDYSVGFWVVATIAMVIPFVRRPLTYAEWAGFGMALGVGMLTKGTFYPFIAPAVAIILLAGGLRRRRAVAAEGPALLLAGVIALGLNLGYFSRNLSTYGGPFGTAEWLDHKRAAVLSIRAPVVRSVQEIMANFGSPSEVWTRGLTDAVVRWSEASGFPQPDFEVPWAWNHEDLSGNPVHMLIAPAAVGLVFLQPDLRRRRRLLIAAVGVATTFVFYAWFKAYDFYGLRHLIPFYLLAAPVFGIVVASQRWPWLAQRACLGLLALAVPYVLLNSTRPVIGLRPRTRVVSVFVAPRTDLLFANLAELKEPYVAGAAAIRETGCRQIGTSLDSRDPEYALWYLLGAPSDLLRIESVRPLESLEPLRDPEFEPCAVFCTNCGDRQEFNGLELLATHEHVRVFGK